LPDDCCAEVALRSEIDVCFFSMDEGVSVRAPCLFVVCLIPVHLDNHYCGVEHNDGTAVHLTTTINDC
jgi:hypothetical protein